MVDRSTRGWVAVAGCIGLVIAASAVAGQGPIGLAFGVGVIFGATVLTIASIAPDLTRAGGFSAVAMDPAGGWGEFHRELARARRFDRSFGIVKIASADGDDGDLAALRNRLAAMARRIDRVWVDGSELFMLLPEALPESVDAIAARARMRLGRSPGDFAVALFPSDGITSGTLLAALYSGRSELPVPIAASGIASSPLVPIPAAALLSPDVAELGDGMESTGS